MAEKTLKFRAELEDKVTGQLKNIEGGLKGFAGKVGQHRKAIGMGMTAMGGAITGAMAFATKSAIDQEQGIRRLDASLKTLGTSYDEQKAKIEAAASALQDKTNFGDEASREAVSRLVAITGDLNLSLRALGPAADVAAFKQMDLEKASLLVGRALAGEATVLKSLGIDLDNNATASEVLAAIQAQLGGQAEASRDAFGSLMARLEDLGQSIAQALVPEAENLAEALEKIVKQVNTWVDDNQVLVGILAKVATAVGGVMLLVGPLLMAIPGLVLLVKGLAGAFIFLNASLGPIGWAITAVLAGVVLAVTYFENWKDAVQFLWTIILKLGQDLIGFVDIVLLGVEALGRLLGIKGMEDFAKNTRASLKKVSDAMGDMADASEKTRKQIRDDAKAEKDIIAQKARNFAGRTDEMVRKNDEFVESIRKSNMEIRIQQEKAAQEEADRIKFVADIKRWNREFELKAQQEAYAAQLEIRNQERKDEQEALAEAQRVREENIRSVMAETDKILAERAKREADHDRSLDRLRENLDETNIAWRESGSKMEDVIKRWAEVTDSSIDEVLTHWDRQNLAVDNVKEVLAEFTKITGEDFLEWAGSVDTATTVAKDTLAGVADVAAEVGGSIRSSLDISSMMGGGAGGIKSGQDIREQFGFGVAETNWFRQKIDEHFRLQSSAGAILGEGSRVDLGEQLLQQAVKQGDDRTIAIAEAAMELEKTALAEKQEKRLADEQAKIKAESDKADRAEAAMQAMRARIADIEGGYANGGITKGGIALVGERGPELVSLPSGSRVHPNGSGVGATNFHFHGAVYGVEDLKRVVVEAVRDHAISGGFTGVFAEA